MNTCLVALSLVSTAFCLPSCPYENNGTTALVNGRSLPVFQAGIRDATLDQKVFNEDLRTLGNGQSYTNDQVLEYTAQCAVVFYNVTEMIHDFFRPPPSPKDAYEGQITLVPYYQSAVAGLDIVSKNLKQYNATLSGEAQAAIARRYQDLITFASGLSPEHHAPIAKQIKSFADSQDTPEFAMYNVEDDITAVLASFEHAAVSLFAVVKRLPHDFGSHGGKSSKEPKEPKASSGAGDASGSGSGSGDASSNNNAAFANVSKAISDAVGSLSDNTQVLIAHSSDLRQMDEEGCTACHWMGEVMTTSFHAITHSVQYIVNFAMQAGSKLITHKAATTLDSTMKQLVTIGGKVKIDQGTLEDMSDSARQIKSLSDKQGKKHDLHA